MKCIKGYIGLEDLEQAGYKKVLKKKGKII